MGTEREERPDLVGQARELERWAAGHVDREARIGDADGTVYAAGDDGQWTAIGTAAGPVSFGRQVPGSGEAETEFYAGTADRFATADDVLDWWPAGDDTYRGTDGHRVEPPEWFRQRWPRSWITAEQWRQAARTPRQDAGTERRRTWNRQLEAYLGTRPAELDGWAPFGEEVAGSQERDGHQTGPYWIDETHDWPGPGRWAARYRRFWETEQGQQPPVEPVRGTPGPYGRVVDERRRLAWAEVQRAAWNASGTAEYLVGIDAPRVLVALREALGWECTAAHRRISRWAQARVDARRSRKG